MCFGVVQLALGFRELWASSELKFTLCFVDMTIKPLKLLFVKLGLVAEQTFALYHILVLQLASRLILDKSCTLLLCKFRLLFGATQLLFQSANLSFCRLRFLPDCREALARLGCSLSFFLALLLKDLQLLSGILKFHVMKRVLKRTLASVKRSKRLKLLFLILQLVKTLFDVVHNVLDLVAFIFCVCEDALTISSALLVHCGSCYLFQQAEALFIFHQA
mmetsp:Transcript_932/g.2175  ORF Transcript_932/g.2175 Transcript_932/m.2175 type:complete len:219 (-) Transcript_932:794-1450(-)